MNQYWSSRRLFSAVRSLGIAFALTGCSGADVGGVEASSQGPEAVESTSQAVLGPNLDASWFGDSAIQGSPVHRKGTNTLDQLLIHVSGQPGRWHRDSSGTWEFEYITGAPAGVTARALAGAYSGLSGALQVFLTGSDGRLYRTIRQTDIAGSTWSNWAALNVNGSNAITTAVRFDSTVAVANRGFGDLDVFWVTNSNTIAHVPIINLAPGAAVSGSSSRPHFQSVGGTLQGEIRAVAWDANRIDVFVRVGGNKMQHTWKANGVWDRETIISRFNTSLSAWIPHTFVVTSARPGNLDLIASVQESSNPPIPANVLARTTYSGTWTKVEDQVVWDRMNVVPSGTRLPPIFYGATHFNDNGAGRINLLGGGLPDGDVFDAYATSN